jgi:hypothetical protein
MQGGGGLPQKRRGPDVRAWLPPPGQEAEPCRQNHRIEEGSDPDLHPKYKPPEVKEPGGRGGERVTEREGKWTIIPAITSGRQKRRIDIHGGGTHLRTRKETTNRNQEQSQHPKGVDKTPTRCTHKAARLQEKRRTGRKTVGHPHGRQPRLGCIRAERGVPHGPGASKYGKCLGLEDGAMGYNGTNDDKKRQRKKKKKKKIII